MTRLVDVTYTLSYITTIEVPDDFNMQGGDASDYITEWVDPDFYDGSMSIIGMDAQEVDEDNNDIGESIPLDF